jgi:hypothetical protein
MIALERPSQHVIFGGMLSRQESLVGTRGTFESSIPCKNGTSWVVSLCEKLIYKKSAIPAELWAVTNIPWFKQGGRGMYCTGGRLAREVETLRRSFAQSDDLPFADLLPLEAVAEACGAETPDDEPIYSRGVTLWMFLSQVFDHDHSCRQAVARLIAWRSARGEPACSANNGGYCKARQRLEEEHVQRLVVQTGAQQQQQVPTEWRFLDRPVKVGDGTLVRCADTEANQQQYPQPDGSQPGLGFPMIRLVVLFCLATGSVLNAALSPYQGKRTGELSLWRSLWEHLQAGDIFLGDRLYCSYFELALLAERGIDVVVKRHQSRPTDFHLGQRLGKRDHVIQWPKPQRPEWLDRETYRRLPPMLTVRELEGTVPVRGFRTRKVIVITTLLDAELVSATDLGGLYRTRWQAEIYLLALKRALQLDELRCKTPDMLRKELWVHLLAYNLIRGLIAQAAQRHGLLPRQISFTGAVQTLVAFQGCLLHAGPLCSAELRARLLKAIATHHIGNRPNRVEPRAIKRRHNQYPRLTKPRAQARKELLKNA